VSAIPANQFRKAALVLPKAIEDAHQGHADFFVPADAV
jgi:hypothetical protein